MRIAVKSHALPVYKKHRIASLLCIFESTIYMAICHGVKLLLIKCCIQQCNHQFEFDNKLWVIISGNLSRYQTVIDQVLHTTM